MGKKGPPPLVNEDLTSLICVHLAKGVPFRFACEAEGVLLTTAEKWLANGKADQPEYRPFFEAVTRARARGAIGLHEHVQAGGRGSQGAQFLLERRYRDEYGNIQRIEHAGHDGGPVKTESTIEAKLEQLTIEELRALAGGAS